MTAKLRLRGKLDCPALRAALDRIVARHEVLRTTFTCVAGEPVQVIGPADTGFALLEQEVEGEHVLEQISRQEARDPFDLSRGPLIRGRLLRTSAQEHVLLITQHRIVADRGSIRVFTCELSALYSAFTLGRGDPLPPLELQYADYAHWQRQHLTEELLEEQLEFWKHALSGAPMLPQLPTEWPREETLQAYAIDRVPLKLSAALSRRLRQLARQQRVSLFVTLLSSWAVLLGRWSGQEEVVIGTRVANRQRKEIEPLIGPFENTLALRIVLQEDPSIEQLLQQTKAKVMEASAHQHVPFEQIAAALEPARNNRPALPVLVEFDGTPAAMLAGVEFQPKMTLSDLSLHGATMPFELALSINDNAGRLSGSLEYASALYERQTIERMIACWEVLLKGVVKHVRRPISRLPLLTAAERERVLYGFNEKTAACPRQKLIHELFEEQVARTPDAVAVEYEERSMTYAQLNGRANQLARHLQEKGVGPDQLVGICVERSLEMVIGLLGILKAGGAYVPLDPNYPAERLQYMLRDAKPGVLLTQERLRERLPDTASQAIALDTDWKQIAHQAPNNLYADPRQPRPHQLAYVIYTSGSTGKPKGVMVEHRNVVRLFDATAKWFDFNERDVWTLFHSFAFDFSVWELWGALFYGGRIVVVPYLIARSPQDFYLLLCEKGVTVLNQTPSAFVQLIDAQAQWAEKQHSLRVVIFGGEALELRTLQPWVERNTAERPRLVNMYGITETTVHVTYRPLTAKEIESERSSPVGKPIPDLRTYLLDRHRQPVPAGVTGEIYVGGAGVARGYLNRPELTVERFLPDPFSTDPQARMYKTGDLGRWRADGVLEYLGRNDDQVKIRGFRIELGEIEAQLARHVRVKEAAVIAREDVAGDKRLVAYVTQRDESDADVEELRAHLQAMLPEHMLPGAFVILESMPLTPSGKLDRRALPPPDLAAYVSREYEAPQGEAEEILVGVWRDLLRIEHVGRQDNFFGLGGNSLLVARMMESLRRVGLSADARSVFESQTLAALASVLTRETPRQLEASPNRIPSGCQAITPQMLSLVELTPAQIEWIVQAVPGGAANIQDIYPLAPLQEGLLFHHLMNEHGGDTYVMLTLLSVSSRSRLAELIAALQGVIDRHDALRTAVLWENLPRSVQVVYRQAILPVWEVALDRDRDPTEQLHEWMQPQRQRLDLRRAPLLRLQIAADPRDDHWYVLLQFHHIVGDNATQEIVSSEVAAHLAGRAQWLPKPLPYRDHVAYALAHAREYDAEDFFRSKLQDIDEPTAPFGLSDVRGDGSRIEEASETLDPALAKRVHAQARRLNMSAATLFHAAWGLVVAHTSARDDVVFGTVLLGRLQGSSGTQQMLGMFINTLPLRLRLQGVSAKELVELTQRELAELLNHEQASLAVAQRCSGMVGSAPLFSALLNYRHGVREANTEWISAEGIRLIEHRERTNYPITFSVDDFRKEFTLTAQTDGSIDPTRIIEYMSTAMQSLLTALERTPQTKALALQILPQSERRQVIESFNATQRPYPRDALIHALFEQQVRRAPDATAVIYERQSLTYAQLNAKANQLAQYLLAQGMQIGEYVPIIMERNLQLIVAQLAVLKAGGAYVPMDPKLPEERQAFIIRDCGARRILSDHGGAMHETIQWMDCAARENVIRDLPPCNLAASPPIPTPAYVMYTSGSTGVPKGVIVPHHAVIRLVINSDYAQISPDDCIAHCSNPAFDASTFEIWGALLNGARVLVVPQATVLDAQRFTSVLLQQRVTVLWLTIGLFTQYAEALADVFARLRYLITGGDVVDPTIVGRVLRNSPPQQLLNAYGPTESTTFTTTYAIERIEEHAKSIPIGRPIANTRVYILNSHLQPVPVGAAGEIHIGGAGVALGYLNRPELTAERFTTDPFSADPHARLYKSGDLGRWRADGNIEFLRRNDSQVKLRGFRIELGEIEAQLVRHPQIEKAIVIARTDAPGEKRLVAYIVPRGEPNPGIAQLREYLMGVLPEYMVPSAIVVLECLPLNANGKLDRLALPVPEIEAYVSRAYEPPQGEAEEILAGIWQELLRVERVGREGNFFELGGHSLLAMQVIVGIRYLFSIELPISKLFEFPTLRALAVQVESLRQARLFDEVAGGDDEMEALLEQVTSMSADRVQELMRELRMGGRS